MVVDASLIFNNIYSLSGLFLYLVLSSATMLPGATILIASYGALQNSIPQLLGLIVLVFIASILGDIGTFFLAKLISEKLGKFVRRSKWFSKNEKKIMVPFRKHTFSFVFYTRFLLTDVGPIVNYISGFEKVNSRNFIIAVLSGDLIYSIIVSVTGYLLKDTWNDIINLFDYSIGAIAVIVIAGYLIYLVIKRIRGKKKDLNS